MDDRLQRRVQRYGWDRAAPQYDSLWERQLSPAHAELLQLAQLQPGERVLDVACGTGAIALRAAESVGRSGAVLGIDVSAAMIEAARRRAATHDVQVDYERLDAEALQTMTARFDVALCALGLMYMPDRLQALRSIAGTLKPGGRIVLAVWGERDRCGWWSVFPIVDAEVASEVCPLFFQLGQRDSLADLCRAAGLTVTAESRLSTQLHYDNAGEACDAVFVGGPVALAWSKFDAQVRTRVCQQYLEAVHPWRVGDGYAIPGEFVIVSATV